MTVIQLRSRRRPRSFSRQAVERRVARRLLADGLVLHKSAARSRWHPSLGDYFLTRAGDRYVVTTHVDLDDLARDLGALSAYEAIATG